MNETETAILKFSTVVAGNTKQYYLFDLLGEVVIGYFLWQNSVIKVTYDAAAGLGVDTIDRHSTGTVLTLQEAREDWKHLTSDQSITQFVPTMTDSHRQELLKTICRIAVMRFYRERNHPISTIPSEISDIIKSLDTENTVYQSPHEHNTQYALEA